MSKHPKFYVRFAFMPFEEDMQHEFKGHKNLCVEELPKWSQDTKFEKGSRKSISRNLCGFLNTGVGGTVYCGVLDDGKIVGLKLTQYQRDHVIGSMQDLMDRFTPKVPSHMYRVKFVPVLGANTKEEDRSELASYNTKEAADSELRKREHKFRSPHYCWCDIESKAICENGVIVSDYVIELTIKPWNPDDKIKQGVGTLLNLHPLYANEEGKIHFRRQASLVQYTLPEIANLSRYEAKSRCDDIILGLKKEISMLKCSIAKKKECAETKSASTSSSTSSKPSSSMSSRPLSSLSSLSSPFTISSSTPLNDHHASFGSQ